MSDFPVNLPWPPHYTVRRSTKAKQIFLQINRKRLLEVVIPEKRKQFNIPKLLNEKRLWIEKHLSKQSPLKPQLPTVLFCRALSETWFVHYKPIPHSQQIRIEEIQDNCMLLVKGNILDLAQCLKKLLAWLFIRAKKHFIPWISALSHQHQLPFSDIGIRRQSTLWGSCNSDKKIYLNVKLIFFPPGLAQHILLHELCHVRYLDHSKRFWALLAALDPQCSHHKKQLRQAEEQFIPEWLLTL